jgi:enolase
MKITKIHSMEVLDSRGNPTVQTTVWSGDLSAKASVPSGASTGVHEAWELRDGDKKRYGGKGVLKACRNVNEKIFKAVKGMNPGHQEKIDKTMIELDGSSNKAKLGANAILSVSLAAARLAAKGQKLELFQYLATLYGYEPKALPTPLFNVINGGVHADSGLDIQEFFIIPQKGNFANKLRMSSEVFHVLKTQLKDKGYTTSVGDEGGFAPKLSSNEEAFRQLDAAIKATGYKLGSDFTLGFDAAASEFFNEKKAAMNLRILKFQPSRPAYGKFTKSGF